MKKTIITIVLTAAISIFAYVQFDKVLTPDAIVVTEAVGETIVMGMLMDADPVHTAKGMFTVVATEGGERRINFDSMFEIVNAPDPHVRINGMVIAKVVNIMGAQSYPIPNFIGEIESVNIWCEIADVSLGDGMIK